MKKIIALTLSAALVVIPATAQKPPPQPKVVGQIVCGLVVLGIGIVVVYEVRKTCKRLLEEKPANANTNEPPNRVEYFTSNGVPVQVVLNGKGMTLNDDFIPQWDISTNGWIDVASGLPFNTMQQAKLESSTNCVQWQTEYTITTWSSDAGSLMLYQANGEPVYTNYLALGATNFVPLTLGPMQPKKFFRIKSI